MDANRTVTDEGWDRFSHHSYAETMVLDKVDFVGPHYATDVLAHLSDATLIEVVERFLDRYHPPVSRYYRGADHGNA